MPIAIWLKDPKVSILVKGKIDNKLYGEFAEAVKNGSKSIFQMNHNETGQIILIPTGNIAMMQHLTDKEVEEAKKKAEKDMNKRAAMGGGGPGAGLISPTMLMPSNRGGRSRR